MQLLEKEIEDYLFEDFELSGGAGLSKRGLTTLFNQRKISARLYRQLNIAPYGVLDIVAIHRYLGAIYVEIFELKSVPIESEHFDQVFRYAAGIDEYVKGTFRGDVSTKIKCYLIGDGYKSGHYIQKNAPITVSTYEYNLNGIMFDTHKPFASWHKTTTEQLSFRTRLLNGEKVN